MAQKKGKAAEKPSEKENKKNSNHLASSSSELDIYNIIENKKEIVSSLVEQVFQIAKAKKKETLNNLIKPLCLELKMLLVPDRIEDDGPEFYMDK